MPPISLNQLPTQAVCGLFFVLRGGTPFFCNILHVVPLDAAFAAGKRAINKICDIANGTVCCARVIATNNCNNNNYKSNTQNGIMPHMVYILQTVDPKSGKTSLRLEVVQTHFPWQERTPPLLCVCMRHTNALPPFFTQRNVFMCMCGFHIVYALCGSSRLVVAESRRKTPVSI